MKIGNQLEAIKTNGIDKYKELIITKFNKKYELEKSITSLQQIINSYKNKKNYWIKENSKVVNDINILKQASNV